MDQECGDEPERASANSEILYWEYNRRTRNATHNEVVERGMYCIMQILEPSTQMDLECSPECVAIK